MARQQVILFSLCSGSLSQAIKNSVSFFYLVCTYCSKSVTICRTNQHQVFPMRLVDKCALLWILLNMHLPHSLVETWSHICRVLCILKLRACLTIFPYSFASRCLRWHKCSIWGWTCLRPVRHITVRSRHVWRLCMRHITAKSRRCAGQSIAR